MRGRPRGRVTASRRAPMAGACSGSSASSHSVALGEHLTSPLFERGMR